MTRTAIDTLPRPTASGSTAPEGCRILDADAPTFALWRRFEAEACCLPFQCASWSGTILETLGRDAPVRPVIALVTDGGGAPLMLVPLMVRRTHGLSVLEFIDFGLADYNAPLIRADFARQLAGGGFPPLWRQLIAAIGGVDAVTVDKIPETIGPVPNPFMQLGPRHDGDSFQVVGQGSFADYLTTRSPSLVSNSKVKRRRLARLGHVDLRVARTAEEIDRVVATVIAQKSRRYEMTGRSDLMRQDARRRFYETIARREADGGLVHLSALCLDGDIVAAHLGLAFRERFYWVVPTFDDRLARCSPGRLLMLDLMEWAFGAGFAEFDFTCGNDPYKHDWANRISPLHTLKEGLTPAGRLTLAGLGLARQAKTTLRARCPQVFAALKSLKHRTQTR
ncbi:MAG TPA: GNAT family N-acetyltransferase [Azospirillum sp.]|nr:GNAT family N-acetyltransferase [Azospirillum sp.]